MAPESVVPGVPERRGRIDTRGDEPAAGGWDAGATAYEATVTQRELGGIEGDPYGILPALLDLLGDIAGRPVLDAGCGTGYLARVLAARGARVTGIDIGPNLIERARERDAAGTINYQVTDLSQPLPMQYAASFDAIASYMVLNDVRDYRGFIATLATALRPAGRLVLALNNPYGAVLRRHVTDYFDSGVASPYRAFLALGIRASFYHRTLQEYLDACLAAGLQLVRLVDVRGMAGEESPYSILPADVRFPRFMVLAFTKP